MPWSVPVRYVCSCGKIFYSTHYKAPNGCPDCRKAHRRKKLLANYHRRRAEGRDTNQKRDRAYDDKHKGKPESVYASLTVIHIRREFAKCKSCHKVTDIINNYCDPCRANGANESQVMNPRMIRAKR